MIDTCSGQIHARQSPHRPCPHCVNAHTVQRAEDEMIAGRRSQHNVRARTGRKNGAKYGKRLATALPPNRKPGTCQRGHDKRGKRGCDECRRMLSGADMRKPVACSVCGVAFVREYSAQRRCAQHKQRNGGGK